ANRSVTDRARGEGAPAAALVPDRPADRGEGRAPVRRQGLVRESTRLPRPPYRYRPGLALHWSHLGDGVVSRHRHTIDPTPGGWPTMRWVTMAPEHAPRACRVYQGGLCRVLGVPRRPIALWGSAA